MGRKRQQREKSSRRRAREAKGDTELKKSTKRDHRVPTLVRHYRRNSVQKLNKTLPIACRGIGTRTPFRILIFCRKGKAKRVTFKPLRAGCRGVPALKLSRKHVGNHADNATSKSKTRRTSKINRWHVALASKPRQVDVNVGSRLVQRGCSLPASPAAVHLSARSTQRDGFPLAEPVLSKLKKNAVSTCCENRSTNRLTPNRGPPHGPGPCTRSRAGGTHGTIYGVPNDSRSRSSRHSLNVEASCIGRAKEDNENKTCTTRRSLRKRARRGNSDSSCNGTTSSRGADLERPTPSGRKKRRVTQRRVDRSVLKGATVTSGAPAPSLKVTFAHDEACTTVSERQPTGPQRRRGSRRRGGARRRGSQASTPSTPHKSKTAPTTTVQRSPVTTATHEQTKPSCFLHWPDDPTRPFCRPAIAFEPADLRLGFNGVLEWPCVVPNAAAETPDCMSQTDEQPRFSLCGGLPDPPRSPPWNRRATLGSDEERRDGLVNRQSLDRSAEASRVTTGAQCVTECQEETSHGLSSAYTTPAPSTTQGTTTEARYESSGKEDWNRPLQMLGLTAAVQRSEIPWKQDRSQLSYTLQETLAAQRTNACLEQSLHENEYDDWTFTPPNPERAQAILNYMGDTIRRIIATTQAAQRRTEMYSRIFERLLHIDNQTILPRQEKRTGDAAYCTPPGYPGPTVRQPPSVLSETREAVRHATADVCRRHHFDRSGSFRNDRGVQANSRCPQGAVQSQLPSVQSAPVASLAGLLSTRYLAFGATP